MDGFGWELAGMTPGQLANLRRLEAWERAEARREEEQQAGRVEARREAAVLMAMRDSNARGLAWDPFRPWANWPSPDQWAEGLFDAEDRVDRARQIRDQLASGELHLLDARPDEVPAASVPGPSPAQRAAASRSTLAKVRSALARMGRPKEVARELGAEVDAHPVIVRLH